MIKLSRKPKNTVQFYNFHPKPTDLFKEVKEGLGKITKSLSPKLFYDETGSTLFSQITQLPEYYPTRTELQILAKQGQEISQCVGANSVIIEYGCGSSEKIYHLLSHLENPHTYIAIDISREHLLEMTQSLAEDYPDLEVISVCADFTTPLELPLQEIHQPLKKVAFFPGSSIGNFEPRAAQSFLKTIASEVGPHGGLLIGVDLKKESKILNAAYNDKQKVTSRFNKNVLTRLNRECSGNFNLDDFSHQAFYNKQEGRVEMHLVSVRAQTVNIMGESFKFRKNESIHTENSYKYHIKEFQNLAGQVGWRAKKAWSDSANLFSIHYFEYAP